MYNDRIVVEGKHRYLVQSDRDQQSMLLKVYGEDPVAPPAVAQLLRHLLFVIQSSEFRFEVEGEHNGEEGEWALDDLAVDNEARIVWLPDQLLQPGQSLQPFGLAPGKKWHFFICHHQGSGGDQARILWRRA